MPLGGFPSRADWQSAKRQAGSLRYVNPLDLRLGRI
jgi:hypothetical protein